MTGSLHSDVRAANEERGQLRSTRLQEHDLRSHRRRLVVVFFGLLAGIGVLVYLLGSYTNEIVRVRVVGAPEVAQAELGTYKDMGRQYLNENPFERFRFVLNKANFTRSLQQHAPEITDVNIDSAEGFMQSEIVLRLRTPVAVWNSGNEQFFVGQDGVAFQRTVLAMPSVTIVDKSANTELGNRAASSKMLRFIGRVVTLVNASGVGTVETVELPTNSTRQADIRLVGKPYSIKTHLDRDPAGQAADVVNAVNYFTAKGVTPKYIDVRVSSKAFYK